MIGNLKPGFKQLLITVNLKRYSLHNNIDNEPPGQIDICLIFL